MLAEARRPTPQANRRERKLDRAADEAHRLAFALAFQNQLVMQRLRIDERFTQIAHRCTQQVLLFEAGEPEICGVEFVGGLPTSEGLLFGSEPVSEPPPHATMVKTSATPKIPQRRRHRISQ